MRPEAERLEGEHLVRSLQVASHTLGHVVRKKVLNSNIRIVLDSCAMLNWDIITEEAQDWAKWKRDQVERRERREWEKVATDASHMFNVEEEVAEQVEKERRINTVKIAKVIRKESARRDQESGPDCRIKEVDQIIDRNGNQLQSIMLKEVEEVECDQFSLVEYSRKMGRWYITTHLPLDEQEDILTITKEVKKQWGKFPWEMQSMRMRTSARNPNSRMFMVNL